MDRKTTSGRHRTSSSHRPATPAAGLPHTTAAAGCRSPQGSARCLPGIQGEINGFKPGCPDFKIHRPGIPGKPGILLCGGGFPGIPGFPGGGVLKMTKSEARNPKEFRMPNNEIRRQFVIRASSFLRASGFGFRHYAGQSRCELPHYVVIYCVLLTPIVSQYDPLVYNM
jgi:hypothetical protein